MGCASFWCVRRLRIHFESMCEKYGSFNTSDCQECFLQHDAGLRDLVLTAPQISETIFMPFGSNECPVWLRDFGSDDVLPGLWFHVQCEHPSEAVDMTNLSFTPALRHLASLPLDTRLRCKCVYNLLTGGIFK